MNRGREGCQRCTGMRGDIPQSRVACRPPQASEQSPCKDGAQPATQARPPDGSRWPDLRPRADLSAYLRGRRALQPEERHCLRDGRSREQPLRDDADRHHRDHRSACRAPIAPHDQHHDLRWVSRRLRSALLPLAPPVPVQAEPPSCRPARRLAARALPGPHRLHRRHLRDVRDPRLDVNRALYDSMRAPIPPQGPSEHDGESARTLSSSPIYGRHRVHAPPPALQGSTTSSRCPRPTTETMAAGPLPITRHARQKPRTRHQECALTQ